MPAKVFLPLVPSENHLLMADGLFVRSGLFYVLPAVSLKPLEDLFRACVITFLVDKGLLPPARANMLRRWVHSGFNVHRSRRVLPREREDLQRLAQYTRQQRCSTAGRSCETPSLWRRCSSTSRTRRRASA